MRLISQMKKVFLTLALAVFCLFSASAVHAADADQLDIELQLDRETVMINGMESKGAAPYLSNDTTLVPMRVITTAFGAVLQWDGDTETITLKYGGQTVKLVIGSLKAEVNGTEKLLSAAPELKNDTTMVPIRFISETFGAKVSFDDATGTIKITGAKSGGTSGSTGMDIDAGKTKIGNSYYGWSMKYPTDLRKDQISFREDAVKFNQADGEYQLIVWIEEDHSPVSSEALLKRLSEEVEGNETVLDKKTVKDGDMTYAKIVAKDKEGYYEHRAYQSDERLYFLHLIVKKEENFKNAEKTKSYSDLLNSFRPSYNKEDGSIKDLSTVKDGSRPYNNEDLGLKVQIPAEWRMSKNSQWQNFYSEDSTEALTVRMTSIADQDTLEKWVQREMDDMKADLVSDALKMEQPIPIEINGAKAIKLKYSTKLSDQWSTIYGYYMFKGNYKYEFDVVFTKGKDNSVLADTLLKSIELTGKINTSYGFIEDDRDFVDRTKVEEHKFKTEKFSVSVPHYWTQEKNDKGSVIFSASAGVVSVTVVDGSLEQYKRAVDYAMEQSGNASSDFKVTSKGPTQLAGQSGYKWEYTTKSTNGAAFKKTTYAAAKNGKLYLIDVVMNQAHGTGANTAMFNAIVDSFRILD
ncbi:copper amine oxidase N-terminal domain-containing protein [Gorillibacterium sp. sgz5001074]|uniref:copper amine oxidase N-terminal domain-containing protein n=1 Tax=Gorillibacterium sp. sgz5001074 TaxID=3446695 RepID=UPI003F6636F5